MARKKNLENLDTMDFGDFDFGDGMDFGFDSPAEKQDRNPTSKLIGTARKGLSDKIKDKAFQESLLKRALPREYEIGFDTYNDLKYTFSNMNSEIKRSLKPGMKELRDLSRKIFPGKPPLISEKLYKKFNEWVDEEEYRRRSQTQEDNDSAAMLVSEVFANQTQIQEAERQEDIIREEFKTATDKKRFELSHTQQLRTNSLLTSLVNYQDNVTTAYRKRVLELQFKSYLIQARMLESVSVTGEKTNKALESVIKNTALPDFVKMRNSEALKEMVRRRLIDSTLNSTAVGRISGLGKRLLGNFSKNIISGVRMGGDALQMAASTANMGDMSGDERPAPKNWRETMQRGAEFGAANIVPFVFSHYANKVAGKTRDYINNGTDGSIRHKIARGGRLVDYYLNNADQHLQNRIRTGGTGVLDSLLSIADADREAFRANSGLTSMQYGADKILANGSSINTSIATEEIIPNWLQRIWGEIHMFRTGKEDYEQQVYDFKHKKFTSLKSTAKKSMDEFSKSYNKDYSDSLTDNIIKSLIGTTTLSKEAHKALVRKIRTDAIDGLTPTPERYRFITGVSKEVRDEIRKAIEREHNYDYENDKFDALSNENVDKRRNIFSKQRNLMNQYSGIKVTATKLMDEGKLDALRALGLVKEADDGLHLDYQRYLTLIKNGFDPEDLFDFNSDNPVSRKSGKGKFKYQGFNDTINGKKIIFKGNSSYAPYLNEDSNGWDVKKAFKSVKDKAKHMFNNRQEYYNQAKDTYDDRDVLKEKAARAFNENTDKAKQSFNGYSAKAREHYDATSDNLKEFYRQKKEVVKDVFVKGETNPRVSAIKLSAKEYYDEASGKVIETIEDIKGAVVDKYDNIVISESEYQSGLIDRTGKRIHDSISKTIKSIKGMASNRPKRFSMFDNVRNSSSEFAAKQYKASTEAATAAANKIGRKVDPNDPASWLAQIYKVMNRRLPGAPDSQFSNTGAGDINGDGIRDNSWQDILNKRKASKEQKILAAEAERLEREKAGVKDTDPAKKGKGFLSGLAGMLGLKGLSDALDSSGDEGGGINVFGLPGFGDGADKDNKRSRRNPSKKKGLLRGAARLGGSIIRNPVGTVLGGGYKATKGIIKGTGKGLGLAARVGGSIGRFALMQGARMALPLLMNPVGLAIAGTALVGYAAYKGFQAYRKRVAFNETIMTRLRMIMYGIDPKDTDQAIKLIMLEEMREKDYKRPGTERPYVDPQSYEDIQRIFFTWDADPLNQLHQIRVADWYNNRGGPVMTAWANAINSVKGSPKLSAIDELNPIDKLEVLKLVKIPSSDPRSPINFPMVPTKGSEGKAIVGEEVDAMYEKTMEHVKRDAGKQQKSLENPDRISDDTKKDIYMAMGSYGASVTMAMNEKRARDNKTNERLRRGITRSTAPGAGVRKPTETVDQTTPPITGEEFLAKVIADADETRRGNISTEWLWPMRQGHVTSDVGDRWDPNTKTTKPHKGIDIAAAAGTEVYAAAEGTVTTRANQTGYGLVIYIDHLDGKQTRYAHLSGFAKGIEVGTKVRAGQLIGYVGNTGQSRGNHLHFEIRGGNGKNSTVYDPFKIIADTNAVKFKNDIAKRRRDALKPPEGYGPNEGSDLEGVDTIGTTAIAKAGDKKNPALSPPPLLLKQNGVDTIVNNAPNNGNTLDTVYSKDKTDLALGADLLDANTKQVKSLSDISTGVGGMTTEQRQTNELLLALTKQLKQANTKTNIEFRRANSASTNPNVSNVANSAAMMKTILDLASSAKLDPAKYLTPDQISTAKSNGQVQTAALNRTAANMPY